MVIDLTTSGTTGIFSTGSAVVTTAVVCSLVFLIIGVLVGAPSVVTGPPSTDLVNRNSQGLSTTVGPLHQLLQLQSMKNLHHMRRNILNSRKTLIRTNLTVLLPAELSTSLLFIMGHDLNENIYVSSNSNTYNSNITTIAKFILTLIL